MQRVHMHCPQILKMQGQLEALRELAAQGNHVSLRTIMHSIIYSALIPDSC